MVKSHKRHIIVDTLGLLLEVVVSAANMSQKAGAKLLLEKSEGQFPRLEKIFADGGYDGKSFIATVKEDYQLDWEVVLRQQEKGFTRPALAVDSRKDARLVSTLQTIDY